MTLRSVEAYLRKALRRYDLIDPVSGPAAESALEVALEIAPEVAPEAVLN